MVSGQRELSAIEVLVKLLHAKDQRQTLLVQLGVLSLGIIQRSRRKRNWSLLPIWTTMCKHSSNPVR